MCPCSPRAHNKTHAGVKGVGLVGGGWNRIALSGLHFLLGWGAAVSREDVKLGSGRRRTNYYSRLEMLIRPPGEYHVLDLTAKGTIANKEVFNRNHFQRLLEVDLTSFTERIDLWILEYAELYAAKT